MALVAFWGPIHGQVGTTGSTLAVSASIGTEYTTKTLVSHTHWAHSTLERGFLKQKMENENNLINFTDIGLDALARFARSRKLEPEKVKDYTYPILKDRLDLLIGTAKNEEAEIVLADVVHDIFLNANKFYDVTLIDVNSGVKNQLTRTVIQCADLVVICLNQNMTILERYFEHKEFDELLQDKPRIVVLGQYDRKSRSTYANISRRFKYKDSIYTVPRCTDFMDAHNYSSVIEFFIRNRNIGKRDDNFFFFDEVRRLTRGILDRIGINRKLYSDQGA
ncbi:CobQ/CobB/MinD/ParA nucleotide binding domain-containing protein (plasmid) [Thermobacillus composti KWC4]|jgi:hypothetical protein|uniref:CobQ/CobB/MinD/ParA nucleotide binding domain-containing protein n=1 Tax=Thermobacillus composti (strain DSM 18247 / JCM 13945 / KWC4) TaxID=717605 RepID=L0EIE1_THECK|nr:chromosome partitioning protein ParA [Thermobacillus composti]AGA60028.1 CobQ/CobB/MinD/ParA nucleotide binding domain-containing protein [Thermobacillus composti KWC4]